MNLENNIQTNESVVINSDVKTPHPVNQITPVSKYLAMALFVLLPFVGGYVGYQLAGEMNVTTSINKPLGQSANTVEDVDTLAVVPDDAEHFLFENKKTGYFSHNGKIYLAETSSPVDTAVGSFDWVVNGPAKLVVGADQTTFRVIASELAQTGSLYAVDSKNTYSFGKQLSDVDIDTVEVFGRGKAFLISDRGLYLGDKYLTSGKKSDLEVYVMNLSEGMSPFNVYINNLATGKWLQAGFGVETKEITAPKSSDLMDDLKLYPKEESIPVSLQTILINNPVTDGSKIENGKSEIFLQNSDATSASLGIFEGTCAIKNVDANILTYRSVLRSYITDSSQILSRVYCSWSDDGSETVLYKKSEAPAQYEVLHVELGGCEGQPACAIKDEVSILETVNP